MDLAQFRYLTFDVVGTLIDFEGGIVDSLGEIAAEANSAGVMVWPNWALPGLPICATRASSCALLRGLRPTTMCRRWVAAIGATPAKPFSGIAWVAVLAQAAAWAAAGASRAPALNTADSAAAMARLARRYKLIAMTNARRWALDHFERELGSPFYATFTVDDTGSEKPDPAFFTQVFDFVERDGGAKSQILHVAQSQYHDIGISRQLGIANCWIERRHDKQGYGGTIAPASFTKPDFHFHSMAELADAVDHVPAT